MTKQTLKQPICKVFYDGTKRWYQNDLLHRINGPAIECSDGKKYWYQNGKRHRIDGPAVEYSDGTKHWFLNGNYHRIDGPAAIFPDGRKEWYIHGKRVTGQEFLCQRSISGFPILIKYLDKEADNTEYCVINDPGSLPIGVGFIVVSTKIKTI